MKAAFTSLLALAASVLAQEVLPRGHDGGGEPPVVTVYTTSYTTVCPVTSTYVEGGKTKTKTETVTSTIVSVVTPIVKTTATAPDTIQT